MKKRIIAVTAAVILVLAAACGIYVSDYYRADETAEAALAGSSQVTVTKENNLAVFAPAQAETGLIFYPGGKVEAEAYAPLLLALAEKNILCVLVQMPCNLAVLDMDAAEGIPEAFPQIERWFIGGHSLGGSMAASFAAEHAPDFQGLVLLAAYSTADLTETGLRVISLYGSEDRVLDQEKYESYRGNLPQDTMETVIEGGNHAFFGSYGLQEGDGIAAISAAEQKEAAVAALAVFFSREI